MGDDLKRRYRRSLRLKDYNYTQSGANFVTICTLNRIHLFGEIIDGEMSLSPAGDMVRNSTILSNREN